MNNLEEKFLKEYAQKHNLNDMTSEDIMKLIETPYIIKDIMEAFNITEKEFNQIRKKKNINNIYLEMFIRDIEAILYYLDLQEKYFSNKVRNKIIKNLIFSITYNTPKHKYYQKALSEIDFSRKNVNEDIKKREIDIDYRINNLQDIIKPIKSRIEVLVEEEKNKIKNYNNKKLYKQLKKEKEEGKNFQKEDLTKENLYELSIIENISDSLIGEIFNLTETQVKYRRKKFGMGNVFQTKMKDFPEILIYEREKKIPRY